MELSIIIPVYNAERYIKNCIDSIINETEKDVEIIVINDGSTDSTKDIIKKIAEENKSVKIFNNDNKGVSYSRNYGIRKASGKYILFLDADDYLSREWKKIIKVVTKNEFDYSIIGNVDFPDFLDKKKILFYTIGLTDIEYCFSTPWSKIYRREFLIENNIFFDEKIFNGEDELFNIMTILKANIIKFHKASIYNYRLSKGSLTKKFDKEIFDSDKKFKMELKKILLLFNLKKEEIDDMMEFVEFNSTKMLINRISYINKYSLAKKEYYKIKYYESKYCLGIFDKIVKFLIKNELYFIIYFLYRTKNMVKTLRKEKIIKV